MEAARPAILLLGYLLYGLAFGLVLLGSVLALFLRRGGHSRAAIRRARRRRRRHHGDAASAP
ncbi:MAG TPA: hypothetical protein VM344_10910 [Vitreimonas sp.]|nr:hypothetical protein [Vitreimonas sp.]